MLITHSDVWDPYKPNNIAQTPTDPQQADVVVTKTVDTPRPEVNANVTFTITVENLGPTAAQNVEVTDLLPPGLEYVSASSSFNFDPNTQIGTWDVGTLDPTNTKTLTITAKMSHQLVLDLCWIRQIQQPPHQLRLIQILEIMLEERQSIRFRLIWQSPSRK